MDNLPKGSVGIDARALRAGPAGVATYVQNLVSHLQCLDPFSPGFPGNNLAWNHLRVPPAQVWRRWNLYHAAAYTCPLLNSCPVVLTVHDISYLVEADWYPYRLDRLRRSYYRSSLRAAERILVPSDFSGSELIKRFPGLRNRVRRTHLGVSEFFSRDVALAREARERLNLPERYILHVGDIHSRRNVEMVLEAGKVVGLPVVLVGKVLQGSDEISQCRYHFSGIPGETLKGIYSAATVFAYPSLYEGFGLPLLEAMACEVPVVAARRTCIPEICGEAAILVEPERDLLIDGIRQAVSEAEVWKKRGLARAAQFQWKRTAKETLKVYEELCRPSAIA